MTKPEREKAVELLAQVGYSHPERWQQGRKYGVTMHDKQGNTVHFDDGAQVDRYLEKAFPSASDYDRWCETGELPESMKQA